MGSWTKHESHLFSQSALIIPACIANMRSLVLCLTSDPMLVPAGATAAHLPGYVILGSFLDMALFTCRILVFSSTSPAIAMRYNADYPTPHQTGVLEK